MRTWSVAAPWQLICTAARALLRTAPIRAIRVAESIEPDSWDTWNSDRDQMMAAEGSPGPRRRRDLRIAAIRHGTIWTRTATGTTFRDREMSGRRTMRATAGWDPFGSGYWMWTPRYGYGWVSGYSWGYLPYQCGNWNFYDSFGWGWAPGMGGVRPWWRLGLLWAEHRYDPGGYHLPFRPRPRRSAGGAMGASSDAGCYRPPSGGSRRTAFAEPDGNGCDCRAHGRGISSAVAPAAI